MDEKVESGVKHFEGTMGHLPPPMKTFLEQAPGAFTGYIQMREWLMQEGDGRLPLKTKHLIFCLLDVAFGNHKGAVNHARAAMRRGLTGAELTEGIVQVFMTAGVATWGRTGYEVLEEVLHGDINASAY